MALLLVVQGFGAIFKSAALVGPHGA